MLLIVLSVILMLSQTCIGNSIRDSPQMDNTKHFNSIIDSDNGKLQRILNRVIWTRLMNEIEKEKNYKSSNESLPDMAEDSNENKKESEEDRSKRRFLYSKRRFLYSKRGVDQEE